MYCKECGKKIAEDSKFCRFCGIEQNSNFNRINETREVNLNISLFGNRSSKIKKSSSEGEKKSKSKYDETYRKELSASLVGLILICLQLVLLLTGAFESLSTKDGFYGIFSILNVVWRVIAIMCVSDIVKEQNRNQFVWGVFTFFMPNLSLFIVGLLKKLARKKSVKTPVKVPIGNINKLPKTDFTYKIISETPGKSLSTGKYIEYKIEFNNMVSSVYFSSKKDKYFHSTYDDVKYFDDLNDCILSYISYKNKGDSRK